MLQGIFGDAAFAKMKKGARVVNVARGGVIDDEALVRALDAGIVAQAALDVFSKEPPAGNPLVSRPDVVCTPHLGASTVEAQEDVAVEIAEAVVDALQVRSLPAYDDRNSVGCLCPPGASTCLVACKDRRFWLGYPRRETGARMNASILSPRKTTWQAPGECWTLRGMV